MSKRFRLTVDAIAYGGEAVGRLESGIVCFFRGALPGEVVEVEITEEKKRFCRGRVIEVITPSPQRMKAECPYSEECPGCSFQICGYPLELEWKQRQFERFMSMFPGVRHPIFPSPVRTHWRNRLKLACENGLAGYRGFDNRSLIPVKQCMLADHSINDAVANTPVPDNGSLFFRSTPQWCGVVDENAPRILNEFLPGAGEFQVPANGFFQTNSNVAAALCQKVTDTIREYGVRDLLELFCGVGVFSIAAAKKIPELRCDGIELSAPAIKSAVVNAENAGVADRCSFRAADAFEYDQKKRYDAVLLDPPRSGLEKKMVEKLLKSSIPLILYVSCGPDTLQRDLKLLSAKYQVTESGAFDMFPLTAHFETFTVLNLLK